MTLDEILELPPYCLPRETKQPLLLEGLNLLTALHRERCPAYRRLLDVLRASERPAARIADVPFLPVGLFKSHRLVSVSEGEIFKVLTSSGTTSQQVSRVFLDRETARRQTTALARIVTSVLGRRRLPMILVESHGVIRDRASFSARGAGVLGMLNFGREHFYALDEANELDREGLKRFLAMHGGGPFLIFGFTFMVWEYLFRRIERAGLDLSNGILIHSGGWKKLLEHAVDNATFKARFRDATGLHRVYNFYGMVEQVGSVFLEDDDGSLYAPNFADVLVRDPTTFEVLPPGHPGVIQAVSLLPGGYPGHSILTEDLGVVHGEDDGRFGRRGRRFSVLGRVPRAELRGCSDTHAYQAGGAA